LRTSNKFLNTIVAMLMLLVGMKIIYTKTLQQGNAGMGGEEVFIGNIAYIIGSIFILVGLYALYIIFRSKGDR